MKNVRNRHLILAGLCGTTMLGGASAAYGGVNAAEWQFGTLARELASESAQADLTDTLPFDQTTTVHEGMTMSKSEYLIESFGTAMDFNFTFKHMPSYSRGLALSSGFIQFIVTETESFHISGVYDTVGVGTSNMFVQLVELGEAETVLFENSQINRYAPDVDLEIGGTAGDRFNYLYGAAQGELAPGTYAFRYSFSRRQDLMDFLPGTADGSLRLSVTPEPATLGLLFLGAMGVAARRVRKM